MVCPLGTVPPTLLPSRSVRIPPSSEYRSCRCVRDYGWNWICHGQSLVTDILSPSDPIMRAVHVAPMPDTVQTSDQ
jgi:hypothetical protein